MMKTWDKNYEMLVKQFKSNFFRIRLVKLENKASRVVFETFSDSIPLTKDLVSRYTMLSSGN